MINHILISLDKISKSTKLSENNFEYILNSLNFIDDILNDFSNVLNCKIFDLNNNTELYNDHYKVFKSKIENKTTLFNNSFYKGLSKPNINMKSLLAIKFIENEFK